MDNNQMDPFGDLWQGEWAFAAWNDHIAGNDAKFATIPLDSALGLSQENALDTFPDQPSEASVVSSEIPSLTLDRLWSDQVNSLVEWSTQYDITANVSYNIARPPTANVTESEFSGVNLPISTLPVSTLPAESQELFQNDSRTVNGFSDLSQTSSRSSLKKEAPKGPWMCTFSGCWAEKSKKLFSRKYELDRHLQSHEQGAKFACTALICNRRGKLPISRRDKVVDHIRSHGKNNHRFKCPKGSCDMEPQQMNVMAYHWSKSHYDEWDNRAWGKILTSKICPLHGCARVFGDNDLLQAHLLHEHDQKFRDSEKIPLRDAGFDSKTCNYICPMCPGDKSFDISSQIEEHLIVSHLYVGEHIQALWEHLKAKDVILGTSIGWTLSRFVQGQPIYTYGGQMHCPCCHTTLERDGCWLVMDGPWHRGLAYDSPELREKREQILRLLPEIQYHPIFEDLVTKRD